MTTVNTTSGHFIRNALALAVSLAMAEISQAEMNDEVSRLVTPDSNVTFGIGQVGGNNSRFGVYSGLDDDGFVGLLDFNYNRRNDETGTWYRASGRNLGLSTRELRVEHERQGEWNYFLDYNQISRVSPYTIESGVQGIGSNQLSVPGTATVNSQYTLKTERQRTTFGLTTGLIGKLQLRLNLVNDDKKGERLFGRGTGGAIEFLAEPIRHNSKQIDLILDYTGDKLQLSGGYYGSFFRNENSALQIQGGATAFNSGVGTRGVAFDNISLPPDNHAHQVHLSGGYQFAQTTRLNFKLARSLALQNDEFMSVRFYNVANDGVNANTSGRSNLGGRVDTTLANVSLTSRPFSKLSVLANLRYEDRDDKTSVARYITTIGGTGAAPVISDLAATSTTDGYNEPRSLTVRSGKLEASYALPDGYRLTGSFDHEAKERSMAGVRVVGYRHKVEENTYRIELSRALAESLSGSLAYVRSDRTGSDYQNLVTLNGVTGYPTYGGTLACGQAIPADQLQVTRCGLLQPIYMADRERQKIRFIADWTPLDQLSAQFMVEGADDDYGNGRGTPNIGVRSGDARLYSLDVSYQVNDRLKLNTWLSHMESRIDQGSIAAASGMTNAGAIAWSSRQKNSVDSLGAGARGKLPHGIEVGVDYIHAYDKTVYDSARNDYAAFTSTATPGVLPNINYRQQTVKLFGTYPVDKSLSVRLDYILDLRKIDDWTWNNWVYTDGTRVLNSPETTAYFIGMSVQYAFR